MIQGLAERRIMNYIQELNYFERWLETNHLSSTSQLLWYKLMCLTNRSNWSEWIQVDNQRLKAMIQVSRDDMFIKIRNELIQAGLVEYQKGKKGCPSKYHLVSFTCIYGGNNVGENEVQNVEEIVGESVTIYKLNKDKTNKKKDTNVSKEKPASAANNRFVPPTLEEVQAYCQERGNKVDAEQFVDFYTTKNWILGKNKMQNWKACVRTWERNEQNKVPAKQSKKKSAFHLESTAMIK